MFSLHVDEFELRRWPAQRSTRVGRVVVAARRRRRVPGSCGHHAHRRGADDRGMALQTAGAPAAWSAPARRPGCGRPDLKRSLKSGTNSFVASRQNLPAQLAGAFRGTLDYTPARGPRRHDVDRPRRRRLRSPGPSQAIPYSVDQIQRGRDIMAAGCPTRRPMTPNGPAPMIAI